MTNAVQSHGHRRSYRFIALIVVILAVTLLAGCAQSRSIASQGWSGVVPANGAAYVATHQGRVIQLDAATGTPRTAPFTVDSERGAGFAAFYATPALAGGVLYAAGYHGVVYALNAETLAPVAQFEIQGNPLAKSIVGAAVPVDEYVVVAAAEDANQGRVYVLEAPSLTQRCRYPSDAPAGQIWATPAVVDGVIYVGSLDHKLHAISAADCSPVWDEPADLVGAVASTPFPVGDKLYIGTFDHKFYEVDRATGQAVELFEADSWFWGGVASDGRRLYIPNLDGNLYAYDLVERRVVWEYPAGDDSGPAIMSTPVVYRDQVVFGDDDGDITVVSAANGTFLWDQRLRGGAIRAPLMVDGNVLYAQTIEGRAYAVNLDTKLQLWSRDLREIQ